jgi:hypothetical protein
VQIIGPGLEPQGGAAALRAQDAGRGGGVVEADRLGQARERNPVGLQAPGVGLDEDRLDRAAEDVDRRDPREALKPRRDHVLGQTPGPGQIGAAHAEGDDRPVVGAELKDLRLADPGRQLIADARDRVLHIDRRQVDVAVVLELERHQGQVVPRGRAHVGDALERGQLLLQRLGQAPGHVLGRGAAVLGEHVDHRRRGVREQLHRQGPVRHGAEDRRGQGDRPHRVLVAQGRAGEAHRSSPTA